MALSSNPPKARLAELPTVAIVGRPNVGKSTLFNRIVGRRVAIVAEEPGVTRDRQFALAEWGGRSFLLADTGGVTDVPGRGIDAEVRQQVLAAIDHADVILLVVDGRESVTPVDLHIADLLRTSGTPVVLAVNKVDEPLGSLAHIEFYELGVGEPAPVAALSGKQSGDLLDRLIRLLPESEAETEQAYAVSLAVIGKPNVGKSSYVNRLLGEDRVAGLRRRSRVEGELEFYSRLRAAQAIERSDVCLLIADTAAGVTNQDFRIGEQAWEAGCGLVLVANKWDLGEDHGPAIHAQFERDLRERAPFLRKVPIITTSALTGLRVRKAAEMALEVQKRRQQRIPTAEVNRALAGLARRVQPPQSSRGEVKILYGTQVSSAPPFFVLWLNRPKDLATHYLRYIENGFRDAWDFLGTPIRFRLKRREEARR
jgi:GTP-binding protein